MVTLKTPQVKALYNFFHFFEKWISQSNADTIDEVDNYLAKSFSFFSNGEHVCKNREEYKKRMLFFKEKYGEVHISEPLEEPIISGDQVIIHYRIDLKTRSGEKRSVQIMAMGTVADNKIERWIQVAGEGSHEGWDR